MAVPFVHFAEGWIQLPWTLEKPLELALLGDTSYPAQFSLIPSEEEAARAGVAASATALSAGTRGRKRIRLFM